MSVLEVASAELCIDAALSVLQVSVISGKDGSILWTLESSFYQMTSDLVLQTSETYRDIFLFKLKGLGSPYRINEDGYMVRSNDVKVIWI